MHSGYVMDYSTAKEWRVIAADPEYKPAIRQRLIVDDGPVISARADHNNITRLKVRAFSAYFHAHISLQKETEFVISMAMAADCSQIPVTVVVEFVVS